VKGGLPRPPGRPRGALPRLTVRYDSSHTLWTMKIAISVPDRTYRAAERAAKRMRVPRSQFYARAVEAYLAKTGGEDVTERLNAVYATEASKPDRFALAAARATFRRRG
jgi:antitoxin MazE6